MLIRIESYSTPASEFAVTIVNAALSASPPAYLTAGAASINICFRWAHVRLAILVALLFAKLAFGYLDLQSVRRR